MTLIFLAFLLLVSATNLNEKHGLQSLLVMEAKQNGNEFHGFFRVNQTYELRFIIRNDFMYLRRNTGQDLVIFYQYSPDVYYLKVFHIGILRYKNKEFNFPLDVPQEGQLLKCLRKCIRTKLKNLQFFSLFLRAKRSFKPTQRLSWSEVVILANMSKVIAQRMLSAGELQKKLLQHFYLMIKGLVNAAGPPLGTIKHSAHANLYFKAIHRETDLPAASDFESTKPRNITSRYHSNQSLSICSDMRRTSYKTHCFGMCGTWCWCWPWVCGDCCLHKGCLEHDKCCQKHGYTSIYCFCPWVFGFDCKNGYLGYPECLYYSP